MSVPESSFRRWTEEEEDDFIIVAKDLGLIEKTDSKAKRNKAIMNQVVQEMRKRGHSFNISHIRRQWKTLKTKYYAILSALQPSGASSEQLGWRHFQAMHEILQSRPRSQESDAGKLRVRVSANPVSSKPEGQVYHDNEDVTADIDDDPTESKVILEIATEGEPPGPTSRANKRSYPPQPGLFEDSSRCITGRAAPAKAKRRRGENVTNSDILDVIRESDINMRQTVAELADVLKVIASGAPSD